jgi:hypothetical protein
MHPLMLFLCALAGAVLIQASMRMLTVRAEQPVASTPAASVRRPVPGQAIGDWENGCGSLAARSRHHSKGATR